MLLCRVVGTVVATRKEERIRSAKLLLVQPVDLAGDPAARPLVAADSVGAGTGETVLIAQGSSARLTDISQDRPIDAVIMAIVDEIEHEGTVVYRKGR